MSNAQSFLLTQRPEVDPKDSDSFDHGLISSDSKSSVALKDILQFNKRQLKAIENANNSQYKKQNGVKNLAFDVIQMKRDTARLQEKVEKRDRLKL